MPSTLSMALIWCKCKNKWIDYVYEKHVKPFPKNKRSNAVKIVLGKLPAYTVDDIKYVFLELGKKQKMPIPNSELRWQFADTVPKDPYWAWVNSWVLFFSRRFQFIENGYKLGTVCGKSEHTKWLLVYESCKYSLDKKWAVKLTDFLIKNIKQQNDI